MVFDAMDIKIMRSIDRANPIVDIGACLNYSEGTIKNKISKLLSLTAFSTARSCLFSPSITGACFGARHGW